MRLGAPGFHAILNSAQRSGPSFQDRDDLRVDATWVQWVRTLFVTEHEESLWLLPGVPADWLKPGEHLQVRGAATYFGILDIRVRYGESANRMEIRVVIEDSKNQRPAGVMLRNLTPPGRKLRKIQCDGKPLRTPSAGEPIRLPAGKSEWAILLEFG